MTTGTVPARGSKVLISADDLRTLTAGIFESRGVGPADAAAVADSLVWANLRGVDSHGVSRVPRYVELFDKGVSVPDATVTVVVSDYGSWRSPRGHDRGRGLKIIESAMDTVDVEAGDGGTRITMSRRLRR